MGSEQKHVATSECTARLALSAQAVAVMELIAQGHSYEQIVAIHPALTYRDIFDAASEVLKAAACDVSSPLERTKRRHPRAYENWTQDEEQQLRGLLAEGHTIARIAGRLQRNRGGIRARIVRLGLAEQLSPKEQDRLKRIVDGHKGETHDF